MMINVILTIISVIILIFYVFMIKRYKFTTRDMAVIGIFSAAGFILSKLYIFHYPQGGGISLLSSFPLLFLGAYYSKEAGITAGLITGFLSMMIGGYVVNPLQAIFDYILPFMALGLVGFTQSKNKFVIVLSAELAVVLSTIFHVIAGVIFFADLAPKEATPLFYSLIYNFSGTGLEGAISAIILAFIPIKRLNKYIKG